MNHLKHYTIFFLTFCFIYSCGEQFSFFREMDISEPENQYDYISEQENQATIDILDPERVVVFKFSSDFTEGFDTSMDTVDFQIMNNGKSNMPESTDVDDEKAIYRCFIGKIPNQIINKNKYCVGENKPVDNVQYKLKKGSYKVVIHLNFEESPAHYMGEAVFTVEDKDLDNVTITLNRQFGDEIDRYYQEEVLYNVNFYVDPVEKYEKLQISELAIGYKTNTINIQVTPSKPQTLDIDDSSLERFWFRHTKCNSYTLAEGSGEIKIKNLEFAENEPTFSFTYNLNDIAPGKPPLDCKISVVVAFVVKYNDTKYFGYKYFDLVISYVQIPDPIRRTQP